MTWFRVGLTVAAVAGAVGWPALGAPLFTNPDFETGDFTGWTITIVGGHDDGILTGLAPGATGGGTGKEDAVVVPVGWGTDPYTGDVVSKVYSGNYSARIGDANNRIDHDEPKPYDDPFSVILSQTATLTEALAAMTVTWSAAVVEPGNPHDHEPDLFPAFSLFVKNETTGEILLDIHHTSHEEGAFWDEGVSMLAVQDPNNQVRPTRHGTDGTWWYKDWTQEVIDMSGASVGDQITIILTVHDCLLDGHPAYARLDNIGYELPPPPGPPPDWIPEPGTVLLLTAGLGLVGWRARRHRLAGRPGRSA